MEDVIKEGSETLNEDTDPDVKDAAIIAAAQRVEHYEIAGYGTARTYAKLLGERQAASLFEQTVQEEKEADAMLNRLAEEINIAADAGTSPGSESEPRGARRKTTCRLTRR